MKDNSIIKQRHYEQVFDDVMALYEALLTSNLRVRRAQLNLRGEVPAEPIDFICDVDIKAKRAGYHTAMLLLTSVPVSIKRVVGKAFLFGGLHLDGDYKTLYFRVKNSTTRNSMTTNEVPLATGAATIEGD